MKQYEAVIEAMRQEGGYATLGKLYQSALEVPGVKWETKTPFASIRRIVQTRPEFFKIKPGLWGLTERKEQILKELIGGKSPTQGDNLFTHSYYQGLIVELGNLYGYATFVPSQDKNKPYLNKKLHQIATVSNIYPFTYEKLVKQARSIDVIWFNQRQMPHAMFEVAHTTNLQDALLKFLEFQDFRINFYIVASATRRTDFDEKIKKSAIEPIRPHVKFINYDKLVEYYEWTYSGLKLSKALRLRRHNIIS